MSSCSSNSYTAAFYLAGGIISGIAESFVIFSYHKFKEVRTHPSSLVYWQAQLDLFFSLQFAIGYFVETCNACNVLSFTFQFFVFGSLMWYFMLSIDLIAATRNPFSDPKSNVSKYHIITWVSALLTAVIVVGTGRAKYRKDLSVCWIEKTPDSADINFTTWVVLWVPMFGTILTSIGSYSLASYRLRQGLNETLNFRQAYLRRVRTYVVVFLLYWLTAAIIYVYIYFLPVGHGDNDAYKVLAFVVAGRGVMISAAWTKNQGVIAAYRRWFKGESSPEETQFQSINHALRMEVLQYSTEAIKVSVLHADECKSSATSQEQLDESAYQSKYEFKVSLKEYATTPPFVDYAPEAFRVLRHKLGIKDVDYIRSIKGNKNVMVEKFTEGRSGSFFYFSEDGKFLVKTLSSSESQFLLSKLHHFVEYVTSNKDSLLTRFLGLHNITLYNLSIDFVVMQNVFQTSLKISDRYDLKGSNIDRNRKATDVGGLYKDNDLQFKIHLEPEHRAKFLAQIESDAKFLCSLNVMDYSLLLGTHNMCYILTDRHPAEESNDPSAPFYQHDNGGLRAKMIEGPGIFFFGIIDILQEYNTQKKLERWFKTNFLRKSKTGISAIPCEPYAARFIEKMRQITTEQISPYAASSFIMTREAAITVDLGEVKAAPEPAPNSAVVPAPDSTLLVEGRDSRATSVHPSPTNAQIGEDNSHLHSLSQDPRISDLGRESMPPASLFKSFGGGGSFRGGGLLSKTPSQRAILGMELDSTQEDV
jgi:1-phosphatidylinositol-4-phosphate 5-kinase